jgi:hypothetical protein
MRVVILENQRKPDTSRRRLDLGRQGLQVAALIAAQLPEKPDEAREVLECAVKIVRDWLDGADS